VTTFSQLTWCGHLLTCSRMRLPKVEISGCGEQGDCVETGGAGQQAPTVPAVDLGHRPVDGFRRADRLLDVLLRCRRRATGPRLLLMSEAAALRFYSS